MERNQGLNQITFTGELMRKLTHLCALVIPAGYYAFALNKHEALAIMIPITLAMIVIDVGRLRNWRLWDFLKGILSPIIREHEMSGDFTGATYILATSCFSIALFPKAVAIAALAFIMAGDPAAAIIGRKFGKHRFNSKSWEGSLSFLTAAVVVVFLAPHLPFWIGIVGAVVATATEALSVNIDDNATVPLISGLVMQILVRATENLYAM